MVGIAGEFDLETVYAAKRELEVAAADRDRALVIDLTACDFLDSTALSAIVGATRQLQNGQANAAIVAPADSPARRILDLAGIGESLPIVETLEEAIDAATRSD